MPARASRPFSGDSRSPSASPIIRFGNTESVFVVADRRGVVIYYEDVEEGFNISLLAADGSIAKPRWEQWKLRHALWHFDAQMIIQVDAFGAA